MKKIIFVPFAFKDNSLGGVNLSKKNYLMTYIKSLIVTLVSLSKENKDADIALVTNIELEEKYNKILTLNDIKTILIPFNSFKFPDNYKWSLAFFKLCALEHIVNLNKYDCMCYIDADVVSNKPLTEVWKECENNILLYDINHGLGVEDYLKFVIETNEFLNGDFKITQYGGEFFASNQSNALMFIKECQSIYNEMINRHIFTNFGDEFILSLAAYRLKNNIKNAGAYIYRYWTGNFYLTSSNFIYNPVLLMHVPAEKEKGLIKIFNYIKNGRYPSKNKIYRVLHLNKQPFIYRVASLFKQFKA